MTCCRIAGSRWPRRSARRPSSIGYAESIIGLYKAEVIEQQDKWASFEEVELATFEWVDWFNNRRLMGPLGFVPPVEYEAAFQASQPALLKAA